MMLRVSLMVIFAATVITTLSPELPAAMLITADKAAEVVGLRNVADQDGEVTGELVNNSRQELREVQLQILYTWRWQDEFHPGADDPGRAAYFTVDKVIAPGQSTRFSYKPSPPLPERKDGRFEITVKVVGFAQVYR